MNSTFIVQGYRTTRLQDHRTTGLRDYKTTDHKTTDHGTKRKAETLERSEKTCVSEGESPSSLEVRLPEFRMKVMNGKV
jgi:hypothetical protein